MRYSLLLLTLFLYNLEFTTNRQLFDEFHIAYEKSDFKKIDTLLSETFVGLNEKGSISFIKAEYIQYIAEWNKTFETKWNVESIQEDEETIKSIEYDTDMFNNYFYGGKMKYQYTYSFKNNKIRSIRVDTLPGASKIGHEFRNKFGKFYDWVSTKYPGKEKFCLGKDRQSAIIIKDLLGQYLKEVQINK
jgi:hypothetical protein